MWEADATEGRSCEVNCFDNRVSASVASYDAQSLEPQPLSRRFLRSIPSCVQDVQTTVVVEIFFVVNVERNHIVSQGRSVE